MPINNEAPAPYPKCLGDKINFWSDTKASFLDLLLKISIQKPNYFLGNIFLSFQT